jgi:hypothetical protein
MKPISYDEFVSFLFDRPEKDTEWYFQEDFYDLEINNRDVVKYAIKLFSEIWSLSEAFSETQLCLGLEYLINSSCGMFCYSFVDEEVPESDKVNAIFLMFNIFSELFNRKCLKCLSHKNECPFSLYNKLCYMWWDVFPRHGVPRKEALNAIDRAVLKVLEKILLLENIACKESALHGLGHWYVGYPENVEVIIKANRKNIPENLRNYSQMAIMGDVL